MGSWKIEITGHGIHHNGRADDANEMANDFMRRLLAAGHDSVQGTFTLTGGTEALGQPVAPVEPTEADRRALEAAKASGAAS